MKKTLFEITELEQEYIGYLVDVNGRDGTYCIRLQSLLDKIKKIPSDNFIQLVDDLTLLSKKSSIFSTDIYYPNKYDNIKLLRLGNGKLSKIEFVILSQYILVDANFCNYCLKLKPVQEQ